MATTSSSFNGRDSVDKDDSCRTMWSRDSNMQCYDQYAYCPWRIVCWKWYGNVQNAFFNMQVTLFCAVNSCVSKITPHGLLPNTRLDDGCMQLSIVGERGRIATLWYIYTHGKRNKCLSGTCCVSSLVFTSSTTRKQALSHIVSALSRCVQSTMQRRHGISTENSSSNRPTARRTFACTEDCRASMVR